MKSGMLATPTSFANILFILPSRIFLEDVGARFIYKRAPSSSILTRAKPSNASNQTTVKLSNLNTHQSALFTC